MSSTYKYPTIKTTATTTSGKGTSSTANLQSMYPGTPGLELGDNLEDWKAEQLRALLDGAVTENLQIGSVNRDYSENNPPNYGDVPTGGGGLPASPWVPNPISPGEGSVNPADIAEAPEGYGRLPTNGAHAGSSVPVTARDPAQSAKNMSEQVSPSVLGQSPATSNAS